MATDVMRKIIAALRDLDSDMDELEETLRKYGIALKDENGDYRSTIEILKDVSECKKEEIDDENEQHYYKQ